MGAMVAVVVAKSREEVKLIVLVVVVGVGECRRGDDVVMEGTSDL